MRKKSITRFMCLLTCAVLVQGCATQDVLSRKSTSVERNYYQNPVLSDEILAIGRPDESLLKQMGISNTIAFLGRENTYMLYLGGEELEQISKLNLDSKNMTINSHKSLYLKQEQIWGEIKIYFKTGRDVSAEVREALAMGGFSPMKSSSKGDISYSTTIRIEGVVYPAIKIPDEKISKLHNQRRIDFYNPPDSSPSILVNVLKAPDIAVAIYADVILAPVYLGMGVHKLFSANGDQQRK